jgi:hypothetical protein
MASKQTLIKISEEITIVVEDEGIKQSVLNEMENLRSLSTKDKIMDGEAVALRIAYTQRYSWVILSWNLIYKVAFTLKDAEGPIIEVFAGTGWFAYFLNAVFATERFANLNKTVVASDLSSKADSKKFGRFGVYAPVEPIVMDAIQHVVQVAPKTIIMFWPDYNDDIALKTIRAFIMMGGNKLLYCGESKGGCCATDQFFDLIGKCQSTLIIPYSEFDRWQKTTDVCLLYEFDKLL